MSALTPDTHLTFHRLRSSATDNKGNKTYIRFDTDSGLVLDKTMVPVLESLIAGHSLLITAKLNNKKLHQIKYFTEELIKAGFVRSINRVKLHQIAKRIEPWLAFVPKRYFDWVLAPWTVIPALAITIAGLMIAAINPDYFPSVLGFFWHKNLFISIAGIFGLNYFFILIHESAHYLTTRAVGGHAKMMMDHQLTSVVVATEEYHLAVLPTYAKFATYIAGLFSDMLSVAMIFILYYLNDIHFIDLGSANKILDVILLLQLKATVWEFGTFLTTDVYYFLTDFSGEDDLKTSAKKYFAGLLGKHRNWVTKSLVKRIVKKDDLSETTANYPMNYWGYLVISIGGFLATAVMNMLINWPKYILFTYFALESLVKSIPGKDFWGALSAAATLLLLNDHSLSLAYLMMKERKK
jgi:hypothetical protein